MSLLIYRASVATALIFGVSLAAFSDEAIKPAADLAKVSKYRGVAQAQTAQAVVQGKRGGIRATLPGGSGSNEEFANPYRSYPPSCLQSPIDLGLWVNDPNRIQATITLPGDPLYGDVSESGFTETDTVTLFRVPCSGGVSATLLEIDRPSSATDFPYPIFPGVYVTLSDGSTDVLRLVDDPNTFFANTYAYSPLQSSDVFVLENYYNSNYLDYNVAFPLYVDNLIQGSNNDIKEFDLAAYAPSQYAANALPLPISGYETGTWYDSAHSGEGIQTEVGEVGTAGNQRFVSVSWYTYGPNGNPYWLVGSGVITVGTDNVWPSNATVTLGYNSNGGFAGDFGAKATQALWGTINVSFPDCNTLTFNYATTGTGIPSGVPTGNGSKTWKRLTQVNGLTCQ